MHREGCWQTSSHLKVVLQPMVVLPRLVQLSGQQCQLRFYLSHCVMCVTLGLLSLSCPLLTHVCPPAPIMDTQLYYGVCSGLGLKI